MSGKGNLRLEFLDVYGNKVNDRLDVRLKHTSLSHAAEKRDFLGSKTLIIKDLPSAPPGIYNLLAYPMRHRPVSRFVRVREGISTKESFVLPVDPEKVTSIKTPSYNELPDNLTQVLEKSETESHSNLRGPELYQALDDIRKAGLLNLYTKMQATQLGNGRSVFSYVSSLTRLRGDRFIANVETALRDETVNGIPQGLFHRVSGLLHKPPPEYLGAGSFKTDDKYGNLQLTFFQKDETLEFKVDADIDDAQGVGHAFQVLSHWATNGKTHPYDIHEILVHHQKLDPPYRLIV